MTPTPARCLPTGGSSRQLHATWTPGQLVRRRRLSSQSGSPEVATLDSRPAPPSARRDPRSHCWRTDCFHARGSRVAAPGRMVGTPAVGRLAAAPDPAPAAHAGNGSGCRCRHRGRRRRGDPGPGRLPLSPRQRLCTDENDGEPLVPEAVVPSACSTGNRGVTSGVRYREEYWLMRQQGGVAPHWSIDHEPTSSSAPAAERHPHPDCDPRAQPGASRRAVPKLVVPPQR